MFTFFGNRNWLAMACLFAVFTSRQALARTVIRMSVPEMLPQTDQALTAKS